MNTDKLKKKIAEIIEQNGAHLVDLEFRGSKNSRVVEMFVDTDTGISADDLAALSKVVGNDVEISMEKEGNYTLIISSPGLDKPLKFGWQYNRHRGHEVSIVYLENGEKNSISGKIFGTEGDFVSINVNNVVTTIALDQILEAKILF